MPHGDVQNPHSAFLTPPWGGFGTLLTARESQLLALSLAFACVGQGGAPPLFFWELCLELSVIIQKFSASRGCPFSDPLAREGRFL